MKITLSPAQVVALDTPQMPGDITTAKPPAFRPFLNAERVRTYIFPGGEEFTIRQVSALAISERGTHRVETVDGYKCIIKPGWLAIRIDTDFDWEF